MNKRKVSMFKGIDLERLSDARLASRVASLNGFRKVRRARGLFILTNAAINYLALMKIEKARKSSIRVRLSSELRRGMITVLMNTLRTGGSS